MPRETPAAAATSSIVGRLRIALRACARDFGCGAGSSAAFSACVVSATATSRRGHVVEQQRAFPVHYSGEWVGTLVPDAIVDGLVVADPKVVETFGDTHVRQMIGYLAITKLKLALLLNFKHAKLQWKRIVRENP